MFWGLALQAPLVATPMIADGVLPRISPKILFETLQEFVRELLTEVPSGVAARVVLQRTPLSLDILRFVEFFKHREKKVM